MAWMPTWGQDAAGERLGFSGGYPSREIGRSFFLAIVSEVSAMVLGGVAIGMFIGGLSRDRVRRARAGLLLGVFVRVSIAGLQIMMLQIAIWNH